MKKEEIIHYYDVCEIDYRLLWDLNHSCAMHAGYWDNQTKSLREALKRENEVLAEMAKIKQGDYILDAGCGVGGSSIFLAQNYGCNVVGITLSEKQAQSASQNAFNAGVQDKTSFQVMDFTATQFPMHTFDVVWGIESVCHTIDKSLFVKEANRILKPGGRLILADGFTRNPPKTIKDQKQMECWLKGWGVENLDNPEVFKNHLKREGFENIVFSDITKNVIPSSRRLYWYSWPAIPLSKVGEWIGRRLPSQTANLYSAKSQYQTLKKGLWQYGIFYAIKP